MFLSDAARRLGELFDLEQWAAWFAGLDRGFVFLFLLPFVVAVVGLWGAYARGEDEDDDDPGRRPP